MTTYKVVKPIQKFWIARDGVVGAAHLNRKGEWVDFRPSPRTRTGHPLSKGEAWSVEFLSPKGANLRAFTVKYKMVKDVRYELTPSENVKAQVVLTDPYCPKPLAAGEPPAEITITHPCEVAGWPLPPEISAVIQAKVAARAAADAERWANYERMEASIVGKVEKWLEGQPANSQVRRWAQRWLVTGKARHQLLTAASVQFPSASEYAIERALEAWKNKVKAAS